MRPYSLVIGIMLVALACGGRTVEEDLADLSLGGRSGSSDTKGGGGSEQAPAEVPDEDIDQLVDTVCTALPQDTCLGCLCQSCGSTAVACALSAPCLDALSCLVQSGCSGAECLAVSECQPALLALTDDPEALVIVMETLTCLGANDCPCDTDSLPIATR